MKTILNKISNNTDVLFLLIFIVAVVFYTFNLGFSDLWSDEIYTKAMIRGSLSEFYAKFRNDLHPPLYYLGLKAFTSVFGLNALSLRMFSVVGVLSTLLIGYFAGQRVFGKHGALYFCLLILAIPMLASYSHEARMYTWAAFSITGVFIYAYLFLKTGKTSDLVFLFVFTLAAMYMHYYSMVAAIVGNVFVFIYLLYNKNKKWVKHAWVFVLAIVLFLPWIFMFMVQIRRVQQAFWAPPVDFNVILSCFTVPFTEQYWTSEYANVFIILIYALSIFAICRSFLKSFSEYRLILWLSLAIFLGTLTVISVISLFSQPILFSRYVMAIVVMLIVPITLLVISLHIKWLKIIIVGMVLFLGIKVSVSTFYFSYGPYKQTVDYITSTYPQVHKVLHITEITAGPMVEYSNPQIGHYWLKAKMSNVDAFPEMHQYCQPKEFLQTGESFCVVQYNYLDLNKENLDLVLSQSELVKTDTIKDNKVEYGTQIWVYLLKYKGK
jgi:uncharacterized membrane protein